MKSKEAIRLQIPYSTMVWLSVMPKKVFYWAVVNSKHKRLKSMESFAFMQEIGHDEYLQID